MNSNELATQYENEIKAIQSRIDADIAKKKNDQLIAISNRLATNSKALDHEFKVAAYRDFKESERYVLDLEKDIQESGQNATDGFTGTSFKVKMSPDYSSCLTTANTPAGAAIEVANNHYIVQSFTKGYPNTATLVHCNSSYQNVGEPKTPFSAVPCRFLAHKNEVILPRTHKLKGDIVIEGKNYRPVAVGTNAGLTSYTLEAV